MQTAIWPSLRPSGSLPLWKHHAAEPVCIPRKCSQEEIRPFVGQQMHGEVGIGAASHVSVGVLPQYSAELFVSSKCRASNSDCLPEV